MNFSTKTINTKKTLNRVIENRDPMLKPRDMTVVEIFEKFRARVETQKTRINPVEKRKKTHIRCRKLFLVDKIFVCVKTPGKIEKLVKKLQS